MLKLILLVALAVSGSGASPFLVSTQNEGRVVGGEPAEITDAPWQVAALHNYFGIGIYLLACGGSIVNENVIITAAHCVKASNKNGWRIRAGSNIHYSGGQVVEVSKLTYNENFNSQMDNDIAIFWLASSLILDGITTKAIALPKQGLVVPDGASAFLTGWGATVDGGSPSSILIKVTMPIVNQEVCTAAYVGFIPVTERMICAGLIETGGKDACRGDSGGPLIVGDVLIGITSWGKVCGEKGFPGVWTRVPSLMDWVEKQLN